MVVQLVRVVVLSVLLASPSYASVLGDAAAALAPGSWVRLSAPTGIGAALGMTGSSGHILTYSTEMSWDDSNRSLYFCGVDHGGFTARCVKYTESTHAWTTLPTPSWAGTINHAYDHNATDQYGRHFYHFPPNGPNFQRCDTSASPTCASWSVAFSDSATQNGVGITSIEFVPWMGNSGSLLYFFKQDGTNSVIKRWDKSTATISTLGTVPYNGAPYGDALLACTLHAPFFCYIGMDSNSDFWTMNSAGTITQRTDAPCLFDWNTSDSTVDPATGHLIMFCNSGVHAFNPSTGAWTQVSGLTTAQSFSDGNPRHNGITVSSIHRHGVIMMIVAKQNAQTNDANYEMWLYKHANSWTARSTASGVLNSQGFDSATIFNTQVNQTAKTDGFATTGNPNNIRDTTIFASGSSSFKCHFSLNAGTNPCTNYWGYTGQGGSNVSFSQNSEIWFQLAFRPDSTWTSLGWNDEHNPKLFILHYQYNSCANIEFTLINTSTRNAPTAYFDCGLKNVYSVNGLTYQDAAPFYGQQGWANSPQGYQCAWNNDLWNTPNCFNWVASQFSTMTFHLRIGTWGVANSIVEAWVQGDYGGLPRKFLNVANMTLNHDGVPANGFDVIELTQFMTSSTTNPVMDVWFDELIISTSPIAPSAGAAGSSGGGGNPPDTTPPAAPTGIFISKLKGH